MNKNDLVTAISSRADMSKAQAGVALDAALEIISKALRKGDDVRLVGFGTFYVRRRAASKGRDPRTGEPIAIKASKLPRFKAGKALKTRVN
jgi:DNA-binding protein HU-beta